MHFRTHLFNPWPPSPVYISVFKKNFQRNICLPLTRISYITIRLFGRWEGTRGQGIRIKEEHRSYQECSDQMVVGHSEHAMCAWWGQVCLCGLSMFNLHAYMHKCDKCVYIYTDVRVCRCVSFEMYTWMSMNMCTCPTHSCSPHGPSHLARHGVP